MDYSDHTVASLLKDIAETTGGNPDAEMMIDVVREMAAPVSSRALPGYLEWSWGADEQTGEPDHGTLLVEIPARADGRRDALPIAGQITLAIHVARIEPLIFHGFTLETPAHIFEEIHTVDTARGERLGDIDTTPFAALLDLLDGTLQTLVLSRVKKRLLRAPEVQSSERWMRRSPDGTLRGEITPQEIQRVAAGQMPFALLVEFAVDDEDDVVYTVRDAAGAQILQDA